MNFDFMQAFQTGLYAFVVVAGFFAGVCAMVIVAGVIGAIMRALGFKRGGGGE